MPLGRLGVPRPVARPSDSPAGMTERKTAPRGGRRLIEVEALGGVVIFDLHLIRWASERHLRGENRA
jgi:hypothetical protein